MKGRELFQRALVSVSIGAGVALLTADAVATEMRRPHGPVSMEDRWTVGLVGALVFIGASIAAFTLMTVFARFAARRKELADGL